MSTKRLIGLELWGEAGKVFIDPQCIDVIADLPEVAAMPEVGVQFVRRRTRVVAMGDDYEVEQTATDVIRLMKAALTDDAEASVGEVSPQRKGAPPPSVDQSRIE